MTRPLPTVGPLTATRITAGMSVECRDARGQWIDAITTSAVEEMWHGRSRRHDFDGVWVKFTTRGEPSFWPLSDIRASEGPS